MTVKEFLLFIIESGFDSYASILNLDFVRELLNKEIVSKEEFLSHFISIEDKAVEMGIGIETAKKAYGSLIVTIDDVDYIPNVTTSDGITKG